MLSFEKAFCCSYEIENVTIALLHLISKCLTIKFLIFRIPVSPTLKAVEGCSVKRSSSIWMKGGFWWNSLSKHFH